MWATVPWVPILHLVLVKATRTSPNTEYAKARQALTAAFEGIDFEVDEIQFIPQSYTTVSGDDRELFDKFLAMLNDLDDVQNVYHNVDLAE